MLSQPVLVDGPGRWGGIALIALTVVAMLRTKISPMWWIGLGAVTGALGAV